MPRRTPRTRTKSSADARDELGATLAELFGLFEKTPRLLAYAARYEQAACLWKYQEGQKSGDRFRTLYAETIKDGTLPVIDSRLRTALLGGKGDAWGENDPHRRRPGFSGRTADCR